MRGGVARVGYQLDRHMHFFLLLLLMLKQAYLLLFVRPVLLVNAHGGQGEVQAKREKVGDSLE